LTDAGFKLAIGSSSKNAGYILERLGLTDLFPVVADGTKITNSKPHPEVFLLAADMLGLRPEDCVVIEDAAAGLSAARTGRFTAVGFAEAKDHELAELSFGDLDSLFDWFDKDIGGDEPWLRLDSSTSTKATTARIGSLKT
ncbi:MAG TPA: HAD-IA family hydrolase, partial [Clostridiaceae bacterium]|nr:HAD-IA family hydrolase [Clostridiaceae bacterium]